MMNSNKKLSVDKSLAPQKLIGLCCFNKNTKINIDYTGIVNLNELMMKSYSCLNCRKSPSNCLYSIPQEKINSNKFEYR